MKTKIIVLFTRRTVISIGLVIFVISASFSQEPCVSLKKSSHLSMLEGQWYWKDSIGTYFDYLPNGEVRDIINFEDVTDPDDGPITYRLEEKNDTLYLIHRYKQMMVYGLGKGYAQNVIGYEKRWAVRISGDCMEYFCFKSGKGIDNHIDEYDLRVKLTKGKPRRYDINQPITKYILPQGFRGHVTIAFNQADGVAPEFDAQGNRLIRIPENGILKTQMKEDAFGMAGGRFKIFIPDSSSKSLVLLPVYDKFESPERREELKNTFGVIMQGFNQLAREDVDRLFGEPIAGNIIMFIVDNYGKVGHIRIAEPWF